MKGAGLRRLRRRAGLTQRELAANLGLHPNSVARMERDEMTVTRAMGLAVQAVTAPPPTARRRRR